MIFNHQGNDIFYDFHCTDEHNQTIVILNGIMMSTNSWNPFMDDWTKEYNVLRFDMYDQGQSTKRSDSYTQSIQVELLHDLLHHLSLQKVHLMGISYGASIALQFAAKYPDLIDKMIVANVVAKTSDWLLAIGNGWNEVAKTRNGLAYYNITIPYIYSPTFYQNQIDWMEARKEQLIPIFSDPTFLDAMIRLTQSAETHNVKEDLSTIETKTLVISSELDYLTPVFEQQYIANKMPHASLVIIPNCGHASMYEVPQLFSSLLLGFLSTSKDSYTI